MTEDPLSALKAATLAGHKIEAIKLYRELFGVGLAEAKSAVEHLETTLRNQDPQPVILPPEHSPVPEPVLSNIRMYLLSGQKIAAIKAYREHNPVGLAEAKAIVDRMEDLLRAQSPGAFASRPKAGTTSYVTVVMLLAVLAYSFWRMMH